MLILYLLAFIPVIIGMVLWFKSKNVVLWEWIAGSGCAFLLALIFHGLISVGLTADTETWSGYLTSTTHYPTWVEQVAVYETVTVTDSDGHTHTERVFSHYDYDTHHEYWTADCTVNGEIDISQSFYLEINKNFGDTPVGKWAFKSGFYSGDHKIYYTKNRSGYIYPTTATKLFENRPKAAKSLFSFAKVPPNIILPAYPKNPTEFKSGRLLGNVPIDLFTFDRMNTRLGPAKKVNVIIVHFNTEDSVYGNYLESSWFGGKKNDLVICYGKGWAYTFGWTEREDLKRNIDTLFLTKEVNNDILPLLEKEIISHYVIKDWHKFDYITIEIPSWCYLVYILLLILTQSGFWYFAHVNEYGKGINLWRKNRGYHASW